MAKKPVTSPYSPNGEPRWMPDMIAGRIHVEPGNGTVTLHLFHWSLKGNATLTLAEVDVLIEKLQKATGKSKPKRIEPDDDYSDIA